ncbi:hypothetical protein GUA87_08715 [Sneathiella sp. P13V-1]|uniref:flagellar basal body-associated FliL family protein n=1 Tax=Sneathiella sp. P13V-1 TaxID=2697366 RepID=UPI00187B8415|nr:flagellar basal body-associated FliL family protein [Sneathiella sp. P13V-1]MBE7636925.1 hypothetical protein [Sneathiella sp. P13V-1]
MFEKFAKRALAVTVLCLGLLSLTSFYGSVSYAAGGGGGEEVPEEGPFYQEMDPLSVPIRRKSGSIKYHMFLVTSLEFDEKDKKEKSRKLMPRIRDAFIQDLSGRSVMHKDKSRGLDFEQIKSRLLKQSKKVLGKNAPSAIHVVKVFKGT